MGRFNKEVEDFVSAFKAGNDIGYRMRYFQLQQRQMQLRERQMQFREQQFEQRQQRGTGGGMPADTQELIEQGRGKRFGPGSENQTTPANKQATVQPNKAEIPDATPTAKAPSGGGSDGATPPSSGGSSGGGDKRASITDRYPGSYQTAALETGTMNDASPVRSGPTLPAIPDGSTPKVARFDIGKAPAYLDGIAQKYGIDPTDFKRMAWIESKFDPNARASSSSAGGLFQFTNDTARAYGLKNKFDGVANAEAAARLWNDNKAGLTKALGRAPTAGELYLAHQQGLGGAEKLLSNPNARAADLLGRDAVVNNGGRANMSAREFSNMWTGRFDNVGNEGGTTPSSRGVGAQPTRETGTTPTQAINTRQRTAVDAGSMSDAINDVRNPRNLTNASATASGARYSSGANPEGKTFREAYNESIRTATPAATTPTSTTPPAASAQPAAAPPGTHYVQYGPNKILIDDKTGAPVENLRGWEHASDAAKKVNNETSPPPAAVPTGQEEFPKTAPQDPATVRPPERPEDLKPAVETAQPTAQPAGEAAPQQDGWSFLDDIGQGLEQFGKDVESFFSDLNVPADWDIGSGDASWGTAADMGGDFGGIGGALGGIGDAIGGLFSGFNRGGMVR